MCIFSRPVRHVARTHIFAGLRPDGRQSLVYSMDVAPRGSVAMVLPVPTLPGPAEDAVEFVDLSGCPHFFDDMARAFPAPVEVSRSDRGSVSPQAAPLRVHQVGRFDASFVPRRDDFSRLDERFRLPDAVWEQLERYSDWGFVVVQLRGETGWLPWGRSVQHVHPFAFHFASRLGGTLFFPTVHVHDGKVPEHAAFDHRLFAHPDPRVASLDAWTQQVTSLVSVVDPAVAGNLLGPPEHNAVATSVRGVHPNVDVLLGVPESLRGDALSAVGPGFRTRLRARWLLDPAPRGPHAAGWKADGQRKLLALAEKLPNAIAAVATQHGAGWALSPEPPGPPTHFVNGDSLWSGTSFLNGAPETCLDGAGVVRLEPFTDQVEPQVVDLRFERLPAPETLASIRGTLARALDRIVANPRPNAG